MTTARGRAWWVTGPAAALVIFGALPSYDGPPAAAAESPKPSASGSASASATATAPDRAGSRPGEGRIRPGRSAPPVDEQAEEEAGGDDDPRDDDGDTAALDPTIPATTRSPATGAHSTSRATKPATRVLRIVPLGSGLILIGFGLGLAFLGLRLRRS
ncbi:hypothetical protein [Streptomyces sp. NPDC018693]|uniref:hypothetical protein n=1 Tax=unclassified Streptomyces TaxID=2593676 RepID=UPI00378FA4F8